ncbi:hypothetical protein KFU94_51515, partial [Chloroflexi bacterium TSY]|nr:hypothetical protein [Chloroflexi bacterium TSY]
PLPESKVISYCKTPVYHSGWVYHPPYHSLYHLPDLIKVGVVKFILIYGSRRYNEVAERNRTMKALKRRLCPLCI